jgi:hypothetical protein
MSKYILLLVVGIVLSLNKVSAQISLSLTGNPPDTSAAWDVDFTNLGVLIPRVALVSGTDAATITTPATSLLVYNTGASWGTAGYYYNAGTTIAPNWVRFMIGKEGWMITGNDNIISPTSGYGTTVNNNFIGTTTTTDFVIATNNIERFRIKTDDGNNLRIGMGTAYTVNLTGSGNPSILHLHDWGTTTNDYSQFNISTSSTNVGRVGVINYAATSVTNERRTASIESYLTAYSAPNASGDLRFYTNNANSFQERMRLYETGQLVLSDNSTFPSPTSNYLFTINPTTNTYRSGISIPMLGASSTAYALNVSTANANSRGYFYENTSGSNGVFYGAGAQLSTSNIVSGYLAYRNSSGLSYGIYGINGTNASYATNANTWAAFIQGRAVISSESSPTSPLGVDLEIRNTTTGSGNPATLSMRQTTQETTTGKILARLNFGDNYTTDPQAQISILREAAGGSGDYPTAILFSNTPDGSGTLTERMRISNNGNVGIGTSTPIAALDVKRDITASSGVAKAVNIEQTLTATANNDKLTSLYVKPTFANGSYTSVDNYGIVVDGAYIKASNTIYTIPLRQTPYTMNNTSGQDLTDCESGIDPDLFDPRGEIQVKLVIRVTSASGTNNFQLRAHNGTTEVYPIVSGDAWTWASTQTGSVVSSPWKDWSGGVSNGWEIHLFGWTDGSCTIKSAYLLIRPKP